MPDLCLKAAFTATSSPPARWVAFLSGIATLFETITSCANRNPPGFSALNRAQDNLVPEQAGGKLPTARRADALAAVVEDAIVISAVA
jgi:hypothetical protein